MPIPANLTITGKSVHLRPSRESDYPALRLMLSDPRTMTYLLYMAQLPKGWTLEEVQERCEGYRTYQAAQTMLDLVIESRETNAVMGECGFYRLDLENRNGEFGIILHYPWWGGPAGVESHLLGLGYGFETLGLHRIEFFTGSENVRMRGFFDKLGVGLESIRKDTIHYEECYQDQVVYAAFEDQWPSLKGRLEQKLEAKLGNMRIGRTVAVSRQ